MSEEAVELSVVVPVYGCEPCLVELHRRLTEVLGASLTDDYEIIYVDDRSPDGAWATLQDLAGRDSRVRLIRLSRNFGQHPAITAGLAESRGRWIVVTDCDLEDPPEEIPRLYSTALEGYDVVLSRRSARRQTFFRRLTARVYRRLANFIAKTEVDSEFTNLSIASRKVIDAFLQLNDLDRQYLLILLWLGFEHTTIEVDQSERYAGGSAYSFAGLVRVAADGIFFQTTNLLRWVVYTGFAVAALGLIAAGALITYATLFENPPPGWASLGVLLMLMTGVIVISTGVTGLYVGKIFGQVKGRPLYVIDERVVSETTSANSPEEPPVVDAPTGSSRVTELDAPGAHPPSRTTS